MRRRAALQPSLKSVAAHLASLNTCRLSGCRTFKVTGEGRQQCHILTFRPLCARIKGSAALSEAAECSAAFYKPGQRRASDAVE